MNKIVPIEAHEESVPSRFKSLAFQVIIGISVFSFLRNTQAVFFCGQYEDAVGEDDVSRKMPARPGTSLRF